MKRAVALALLALSASGAGYEWGGPARSGVRDLKAGRYDEALRELEKGRADFPGASVVPYDEGVAYMAKGQPDSALVRFQEAMKLRGDRPREAAAYNLGNMAMRTKDYEGAVRAYKDALRVSPSDRDAKRNLEEALRQLRRPSPSDRPNPPSGKQGPPNSGAGRPQPSPSTPGKGETPPPRGGPGAFTKDEAERWLQALESERRARRQEGKGHPDEETGNRDW